jgi:hypothetical protein
MEAKGKIIILFGVENIATQASAIFSIEQQKKN